MTNLKGDINFNFKINKKIGLLLVGFASLFATADFVSLVDTKAAGGIVIEKETMTVGSVVFRMDNVNPSTIYGGTWQLITGDATLTFGDGSSQSGIPTGENDPIVPIVAHSHSMNHDHPAATTNTDTHNHGVRSGVADAMDHYYKLNRNRAFAGINPSEGLGGFTSSTGLVANDSHNHTVDLPNYTGNTGVTGVSDATLNVRGQRIAINVWKRIN